MVSRAARKLTTLTAATASLFRGDRGWILVAVSAGWFMSFGVRLVYPALVSFFRDGFGLSLSATGLLLTTLWTSYALGHVPGGLMGDRLGEGRVLTLSTVLAGGTMLGIALANAPVTLFVATAGFGLATALYGPTRFTVLTDVYGDRAGSAIGLTMAAGNAGNALLPVVAVLVATATSWRVTFGALAPLFLCVALGVRWSVPARTSEATGAANGLSRATLDRLVAGVRHGSILTVVAVQVCFSFTFQGLVSFYPLLLTDVKGLAPETAASLFGLFFVGSFLVQPVAGACMDRYGTRLTLVAVLLPALAGLLVLPLVEGTLPLVALTLVLSTVTGCTVLTQTYIADTLPPDVQGTGLGVLKAGWMLLGATSPVLVGVLGEYGYLSEAFSLFVVTVGAALALALVRLDDV